MLSGNKCLISSVEGSRCDGSKSNEISQARSRWLWRSWNLQMCLTGIDDDVRHQLKGRHLKAAAKTSFRSCDVCILNCKADQCCQEFQCRHKRYNALSRFWAGVQRLDKRHRDTCLLFAFSLTVNHKVILIQQNVCDVLTKRMWRSSRWKLDFFHTCVSRQAACRLRMVLSFPTKRYKRQFTFSQLASLQY